MNRSGLETGAVHSADVALLQLDHAPATIVSAPLGDSDKGEIGDEVFVVGASYSLSFTLPAIVIKVFRRDQVVKLSVPVLD